MHRLPILALLAGLAGCAGGGGAACRPAGTVLENTSSLAVEQAFLAPNAGTGWGPDLLGQAPALPAGGRMPLAIDGPGPWRLRLVWVTGRAIELDGIDGCRAGRIILSDNILTAE